MELQWKSRNGRIVIKGAPTSPKDAFGLVATLEGSFEADSACGLCNGTELSAEVRHPKGFTYYSLACIGCGAELQFGQHEQSPTLFAKKSGENRGWAMPQYGQGDDQQDEPARTTSRPPARGNAGPPPRDDSRW